MKLHRLAAGAAFGLLLPASAARALPGALDPTFAGGAGKTRFGVWPGGDDCRGVGTQSDGKLLLAGTTIDGSGSNVLLIRLNADGTPDAAFGAGGKVSARFLPAHFEVYAMQVLADDRIVVVGSNGDGNSPNGFAAARFTASGAPDSTFDGDGCVITRFDNASAYATALAVQSDGRLVLAGYVSDLSNWDFAAARYNADGSLDASFDGDGRATADMLTNSDVAWGVTLQADGKIVLAGSTTPPGLTSRYAVARLTTGGALDATFDGDGRAFLQITGQNDVAQAVAMQPAVGGKPARIVVAGSSYDAASSAWGYSVARYNLSGSLDTSFDGDGKRVVIAAGRNSYGNAVAIQTNRNDVTGITVGGTSQVLPGYAGEFGLMRFTAAGALDTSFDGDGMAFLPGAWSSVSGNALRVTGSGIVMAGTAQTSSGGDVAVARFTSAGALDLTFNGTGTRTEGVGAKLVEGRAVALQTDGRILVAGRGGAPRAPFELVRCLPDGGLDAAFGAGGVAAGVVMGAATPSALLVQPDGRILVAGAVDSGFDTPAVVARYLADGQLDPGFGTGGIVTIEGDDLRAYAGALALQPDGKIVVAGGMYVRDGLGGGFTELMVVRLNANGTVDGSFGSGGRRLVLAADAASGVAVDANNRIVVACPLDGQFGVYRFTPGGALDPTFGGYGWAQTPVGTAAFPSALLLQPDGRIVVAGTSTYGFGDNFTLARYEDNGTLDAGFGSGGIVVRDLILGTDRAYALARQADGRLLVGGTLTTVAFSEGYFLPDPQFALAAFLPDGAIDTGYGSGGLVTLDLGGQTADVAYDLVLDPQGRALLAGTAEGLIGLARLTAGATSGAPEPGAGGATLRLGPPMPNPLRRGTRLALELSAPGRVTVSILDVSGRLVRHLVDAEWAAGSHALAWDGADDRGRAVANGVYFLALATPEGRATRRLVVAR